VFTCLVPLYRNFTAIRRRYDNRHMEKSMWAIDYLTNCRRFLLSWSLLGPESGDVWKLDRDRRGTFSAGFLERINNIKEDRLNNIKEDRLKTGAAPIVQASRGYVPDKDENWEQRFKPCEIVLFEDLSRYRMRTDRPRRENSQLMK